MDREKLNAWLALVANLAVVGGLVFVGLEIRQNTSQLRADASHSITESVNQLNEGVYADSSLAKIIMRGEDDLDALDPTERWRFDAFQFSRLNVAEYILDLEGEGVSDLNFRYVDFIIHEFRTKPGLQAFIRSYEHSYVGSDELLARLTSR